MDNIRKTEFSNVSKKEKRGAYHDIKKSISMVISLLLIIIVIIPTNVFASEKEDNAMPLSVIQEQYRDASIIFQTSFEDGTILIEQVIHIN